MSKLRHNKRHTKDRALQRLGVVISTQLYNKLIKQIQNDELPLAYKISNSKKVFSVNIEDKEIHIVYNRDTKSIVSVKTPEMY